MKRLLQLGCLFAIAGVAFFFSKPAVTAPAEEAAVKLWNSLNDQQKKEALLPLNSKNRYSEVFPPVKRPGISLDKLSDQQMKLLQEAVRAMTSEYGTQRILKLAKQGKMNQRYLTFFGEPAKGKPFAWRMAQHHLTVLYAEFGSEKPNAFGPVLLGGNPVKTLWDAEDAIYLKLFDSLSDKEKQAVTKGKGIQVAKLNSKARKLAAALLKQRLAVFTPTYRKNFEMQLKKDGGVDNLYFSIKGKEMGKTHHVGGRYHWKLSGARVLCDFQTRGNEHIHMTLHAFPPKKKA